MYNKAYVIVKTSRETKHIKAQLPTLSIFITCCELTNSVRCAAFVLIIETIHGISTLLYNVVAIVLYGCICILYDL